MWPFGSLPGLPQLAVFHDRGDTEGTSVSKTGTLFQRLFQLTQSGYSLLVSSDASNELPSNIYEGRGGGKETPVFSILLLVHHTCLVNSDKWCDAVLCPTDRWSPHAVTTELLLHCRGRGKRSTLRLETEWKMLAWSTDIFKVQNNFPKWHIFQSQSYRHLLFHCHL